MKEREKRKRPKRAEKKKQNLITDMKIQRMMREIPDGERLKIID